MSPLLIKISKDLKLARCYPRSFTFYVAEPLSSIRMSPLLIKISKDFATIWTTIDPIGNGASFAGRLFARDDYFCAVAKPTKEFLAVLPAKSELGDVSETKSANNISEEISLGFVEVGV